jgi:hypothetical protein
MTIQGRLRTAACALVCASLLTAGCAGSSDDSGLPDDEYGMDGELDPTPAPGKFDSENRRGLWVNTNTTRTQVWDARNKWNDTDQNDAARAAGIAWSADSGLDWDEKFSRWVASFDWIESTAGYYDTFVLTTPWGKSLPSPALECAEMAMFLRITFAAWYELPFFLEAVDRHGTRIYFGHNGVRTQNGRYNNTPEYGRRYDDHSDMATADYEANWPEDSTLRKRKLYGGTDSQPMLGPDSVFGEYVDEIHLNKRAGYFTMLTINYLGSVNLADTANTYNIVPEAVTAGDVLLERWQRRGIGHTLMVKESLDIGEGNKDLITISGSMPRRQGKKESGVASKGYFTSQYSGGPDTNDDGDVYAKLGGGAKRFRVTKNVAGYWTNTWMAGDEASWINSTDYNRIGARIARFEQMLGQVSPQQLRTELLAQIEDARHHLRNYPASCAARERRERAFEELYDLSSREFGEDKVDIDRAHRMREDYVLNELVYNQSRTCCWNQSTSNMFELIMSFADAEQAEADANDMCVTPTVFRAHTNGYDRWAAHAQSLGRGNEWRPWSEDESCAQRDVAQDSERDQASTAFCDLPDDGGGDPPPTCTDVYESNDTQSDAATPAANTSDLQICDSDDDWYEIGSAATVRIEFDHDAGDLDLAAYDGQGTRLDISQSTSDSEELTLSGPAFIKVYGYSGATGSYSLSVL